MHQNRKESLIIGDLFDKIGFQVDIVNHDKASHLKKREGYHYNISFGRGEAFDYAIRNLSYDKSIYYATGLPAKLSNKFEEERVRNVNKKYNQNFKPARHLPEEYESYSKIDHIIAMGNRNQYTNYENLSEKRIFLVNNLLVDFDAYRILEKDWEKAKNNFLFVGSKGKILSGLDLLLEIFKERKDINLQIGRAHV